MLTPIAILLAVGASVVGVLALAGGVCALYTPLCDSEHTVRATFDRANQLVWGQEVRLGGRKVGEIKSVEEVNGHAVVELKISDDEAWPLRRGTLARARFGSTTSYVWRYIELVPGPAEAPALADGGVLGRTETVTPFEYDDTFRIFRGRTDDDLRKLVGGLGDTLGERGPALGRAFRDAPGGIDESRKLVRELGASEEALRLLVVSGDRTTSALAARDTELRSLVSNLAETFDEFAEHADDQRVALDRLPETFRTSTVTLGRLDRSLVLLDALLEDLQPGARELRKLAPPLQTVLIELSHFAPLATETLSRGTRAAPPLTRFLEVGTDRVPQLGNVLGQLEPMVGCLRPYGPEIAGTLSDWTGFGMNYDEYGHYVHGVPLQSNPLLNAGSKLDSEQTVKASGGRLLYAMPRPPGLNAAQGIGRGEPFFQPQCGAGRESLDAGKDPEASE